MELRAIQAMGPRRAVTVLLLDHSVAPIRWTSRLVGDASPTLRNPTPSATVANVVVTTSSPLSSPVANVSVIGIAKDDFRFADFEFSVLA